MSDINLHKRLLEKTSNFLQRALLLGKRLHVIRVNEEVKNLDDSN